MKKKSYLLITLIIIGRYITFPPFDIISLDIYAVITWIWGIYGFYIFKPNYLIFNKKNFNLIGVFFLGILLSMISAYINHDQSFYQSLITQRYIYNFLFLLVLLKVAPSQKDLMFAIKNAALISIAFFVVSQINPEFFIDKKVVTEYSRWDSSDFLFFFPGGEFVIMYYFILLDNYIRNNNNKIIFQILLVFGIYLLIQNRSTLIFMTILLIYSLYKKKQNKIVISSIVIGLILLLYPYFSFIIEGLITETTSQLADTDYNRWQALSFFLFDYNEGNWIKIVFGNGIAAKGTSYLNDMQNVWDLRGAHYSDIGLIGDWFLFGLIPVGTIIYVCIVAIKNKFLPLWVKFIFVSILLVPSIKDFHTLNGSFNFAFYFYLYYYYSNKYNIRFHGGIDNNSKLQNV